MVCYYAKVSQMVVTTPLSTALSTTKNSYGTGAKPGRGPLMQDNLLDKGYCNLNVQWLLHRPSAIARCHSLDDGCF